MCSVEDWHNTVCLAIDFCGGQEWTRETLAFYYESKRVWLVEGTDSENQEKRVDLNYILEVELRGLPDRFDVGDKLKSQRRTFKFLACMLIS